MESTTGVASSTILHKRYKCREASGADFAGEKEEDEREEEETMLRCCDVAMCVLYCILLCGFDTLLLSFLPSY
jgi:hypothetical protein